MSKKKLTFELKGKHRAGEKTFARGERIQLTEEESKKPCFENKLVRVVDEKAVADEFAYIKEKAQKEAEAILVAAKKEAERLVAVAKEGKTSNESKDSKETKSSDKK